MLLEVLSRYLEDVESVVRRLRKAHIERYEEEILSSDRVNLRIRIRFSTGYLLELNEAVVFEGGCIKHLGYRYHLQDEQNHLIFRYDNAPHFPEFETFPHHKHLPDKVIAVEKPSILGVIEEAKKVHTRDSR